MLPSKGEASTYSDFFRNKKTANGQIYTHEGYSCALLPRERWYVVSMGTLLKLGYKGKEVVVIVNDRGAGNKKMNRVLDLSRAAYAYLKGVSLAEVTDKTAGLIQLESIVIMPDGTPLGPVR